MNSNLPNIEERSNSFFEDINIDEDLMDDFPKLKDPLLKLTTESMQDDIPKELSFYGLDIENIEDLIRTQKIRNPSEYTILRVMHCNQLVSMKGIQQFTNLQEINLSSNSIMSMAFLETLTRVETLNLSCNKITQIFNLQNMASSLRKLILSHNRIVSLQQLKDLHDSALEHLDLNDNYIGDLEQVKHLQVFPHLQELIFQQKNGSNPMCDFENYEDAVKHFLPGLIKLDGKDLNLDGGISSSRSKAKARKSFENQNPNIQKKRTPTKLQPQKTTGITSGVSFTNVNSQKELAEQDQMIERLYNDIKDLHIKLEKITSERNEALEKYDSNEKYWRQKFAKSDQEGSNLFELNKSLKEDNHDLLIQLEKFTKRIKMLENEREREKEATQKKDEMIVEMNKQTQFLVSQLEDMKDQLTVSKKELTREVLERENEEKRHSETKSILKSCEEKCSSLYQDVIKVNQNGMERWTDIQRKYEDAQSLLNKHLQINEDLNAKIMEYKEINNQLEYSWSQKYEQMIREKETVFNTLKDTTERAINMMRHDYEKKISDLQLQFKQDIVSIDQEARKQRKELQEKYDQLKSKHSKALQQISELKEVLQMAVEADTKKESLLEELKIATRDQREKIDREKDQLQKDLQNFEQSKKEQREEVITLKAKLEENEYYKKEQSLKLEKVTQFLNEKTKEYEYVVREYDSTKRQLRDCQVQLDQLKDHYSSYDDQLKKELDEQRLEIEDLNEIVKMKDRMLDDQNVTIQNMKQQMKSKDDELNTFEDKQNKYYKKYEDKINQQLDENERLKQKNDDLSYRLQELEDELEQMRQETQDQIESAQAARQALKEKESIIDLVEQEILNIKARQEDEKSQLLEKEELIAELRDVNQELVKQNDQKAEEIRMVIDKMEQYKKHKDQDILKLKKKLAQAEEDIKMLIVEQEKQKRAANEKIKMLHEMFK